MSDECIIFSDPRSTTLVQIATRDGSQKSVWLGQMKYTNLKVFDGQNRNSTATFTIFGYNSSDSIDSWMLPGIAVFVVRRGHLRFSGVISKVDGEYAGYDLSQMYRITCESDANWLLNRTTCTKSGVVHKQHTPKTILMDVLDPDINWYNRSSIFAAELFDDTAKIDYTITDKPVLVQVQELSALTGMKYRARTFASRLALTGALVNATPSVFTYVGGDTYITTTSATIGRGSHNKWILLLVSDSTGATQYHSGACAVTASTFMTNITPSSTNAINFGEFTTGRKVILIQHPVLEFKPRLETRTTSKLFYINPPSTGGILAESPCWNYSPLAEKNDVITKVSTSGWDTFSNPYSITLTASYKFNYTDREFLLDAATSGVRVTIPDAVNLFDTTGLGKVLIYADAIPAAYAFAAGDVVWVGRKDQSTSTYEIFTISAITNSIDSNGRAVVWLLKGSALTNNYYPGDIVSFGRSGATSKIYLNDTTNITVSTYAFVGRERVYVIGKSSDARGSFIWCNRGYQFTSSQGYITSNLAIPHKSGCPVMEGAYFDRDDYYTGASPYESPVKTYGINTKNITVSKAVDTGTIELVCYNVLRHSCKPKYKGSLSCFIDALVAMLPPYECMRPGDVFRVDYFGTLQPTGATYEIMSLDMDFDSGTCLLQFDEYDISLMMALANMGLSINIT